MDNEALGALRHHVRTMLAHEHTRLHGPKTGTAIYQTSTMAALLDGIYDGDMTIAELLTHGDFGLGTFNHLDGEMIVLNGTCHQLRSDGSASIAAPGDRTPFAAVTWFKPDQVLSVPVQASRADVARLIDRTVTTTNLMIFSTLV